MTVGHSVFGSLDAHDLEFKVEVWDDADMRPVELVALACNVSIARAAFEEAKKARPGRNITLRHRTRVIAETRKQSRL